MGDGRKKPWFRNDISILEIPYQETPIRVDESCSPFLSRQMLFVIFPGFHQFFLISRLQRRKGPLQRCFSRNALLIIQGLRVLSTNSLSRDRCVLRISKTEQVPGAGTEGTGSYSILHISCLCLADQ